MARRVPMEQVELLGLDEDVEPVDEVGRARGAVAGWLRRHRVLAAVAALVLVTAVAVPITVAVRADRARAAVLAAIPQVLASTPTAPEVAWSTRPDVGPTPLLSSSGAWVRGDVLVSWDQRFDSTQRLRAVDVRTGEELWAIALTTRPDLGDQAALAGYDPTRCEAPTGASVVVCVVPDSWRLGTAQEVVIDGEPVEPAPSLDAADLRLRSFDLTTGEKVLDLEVADLASFVLVDGDVVLAQTPDSTGPSSLERLDPLTGDARWSVSIPRPEDSVGSAYADVQLFGDELAVAWLGSTSLFGADGADVGTLDADQILRSRGHLLTMDPDEPDVLREVRSGRALDTDGDYPAWIGTDDGSAPEMLVLQGDGLRGLDVTTGNIAWSTASGATATTLVVMDGMLAYLADGRLVVCDLRTGDVAWSAEDVRGQSLVTDGERLVALTYGPGRDVTALDLRDGRRAWVVDTPTGIESLSVVDHRLFGAGGPDLVAFEPVDGYR